MVVVVVVVALVVVVGVAVWVWVGVGVGVVVWVGVGVAAEVVVRVEVRVEVWVWVGVGVGVEVEVGVEVGVCVKERTKMNDPLIGKLIVVMCANYIYTGILSEMRPDVLVLSEPSIVYETGSWSDETWKDAQRLPTPSITIERSAGESRFELIRK